MSRLVMGIDTTLMASINKGSVKIWETESLRLKYILFQLSMRHFSENARRTLPQKMELSLDLPVLVLTDHLVYFQ